MKIVFITIIKRHDILNKSGYKNESIVCKDVQTVMVDNDFRIIDLIFAAS